MPGVAESIPHLRRWVRLPLAEDGDLADAFELIVSEYGTNALQHSASGAPGGRIKAELSLTARHACLAVFDGGSPFKKDAPVPDELAVHGRGLFLTAAHADESGQFDTLDGRTSWALINF